MMKQLQPFRMNISATITNIMSKEKKKMYFITFSITRRGSGPWVLFLNYT